MSGLGEIWMLSEKERERTATGRIPVTVPMVYFKTKGRCTTVCLTTVWFIPFSLVLLHVALD